MTLEELQRGDLDSRLEELYVDKSVLSYQKKRYADAFDKFKNKYGDAETVVFSAPGRSEISGNHTDHQRGMVLAAAVNLDAIAITAKRAGGPVRILSEGYDEIIVETTNVEKRDEEEGTTAGLIRGMLFGLKERGYNVGGFDAYVTSDVLTGAGLSSSAAFEVLVGTILSGLYNDMKVSAVEIAKVAQYAENVYFGKPCGLMDQMACSVGNLVHVDFSDPSEPVTEKIDYDLSANGYSLCITDTKGSHANLTDEYAAIPGEMKEIASFFNKEVLLGVTMEDILNNAAELRQKFSDRAVLRAIHFIKENERVRKGVKALKENDTPAFMKLVRESGRSSFEYLQNVYSVKDVLSQNISLALAISDVILTEDESFRVHGGGFAGTIQAFVKNENVDIYKSRMEAVFRKDSCHILKIRKFGGIKVL